jgi:hypothetical protein
MNKSILIIFMTLILIGCNSTAEKQQVYIQPFDSTYSSLADVLSNYVVGELFDYSSLKNNRAEIDKFVGQLAGLTKEDYYKMTADEQKAMWINAYNGITLRSIIDSYPVKSIKDIKGVWDKTKWSVAGQEVTLDQIEHKILRVEFLDGRIHFAVNCASIGCPPLLDKPFIAETLEQQLDEVTTLFVNHPIRNIIDIEKSKINTTKIFKWFGDDFSSKYTTDEFYHLNPKERAVLNFIFTYIDESSIDKIDRSAKWKIDYASYDWGLNDIVR